MGVISNLDIQVKLKGRARLPALHVAGRATNSPELEYGVLYRFWEQQLTRGLLDELVTYLPDRLIEDTTIAVYGLKPGALYRYLIGAMIASQQTVPSRFDHVSIPGGHYWHFIVRAPYWIETEELWQTVKQRCSCQAVDSATYGIELYTNQYIQSQEIRQIEFLMPAEVVG
ncbi:GyrI-like domain-containing protein [Salinibius halmophilus]|uniref:GyrI-like domain-containing protein n=1 Tax=Salinibius halmophilus TaxID=1853216 RepID=UPI000E675D55|nr:GyrI-like domain-containing protein [Salinibius halmophilus]